MRKRTLPLAVATATLIGGFGLGAPAALAHHKHDDFTLKGKVTDFDRDDRGRDGWSEGDKINFKYDFRDEGDGDGVCEITKLDRHDREFEAECEATFDLDDGKIDLEGTLTEDDFRHDDVSLDIVDGTGDYDDADGTATFRRAGDDHHDRGEFKVDVDLD